MAHGWADFPPPSRRSWPSSWRSWATEAPPDWIERPARTFGNLMEVPTLFYGSAGGVRPTLTCPGDCCVQAGSIHRVD